MQLLTFLGTGKYNTTCYTWQGREKETSFVAEALSEFFQPQQVKVFVTKEAREMYWEQLNNCLSERVQISPVSIPSGKSETEIWEIFEAVVNAVEPNSQVLFDITHAFRSIPLLVLLAAAFLQKARNVEIKGVYYGAFDVDRNRPPIFDLTPAIKLLDWLAATDKFLTTGSSIELGKLLSTIQHDFYRQGKQKEAKIKPKLLQKLGVNIDSISRSLELIRPIDLMRESAKLQDIPPQQLQDELGAFAKPFELLLSQIQLDYGQFSVADSPETEPEIVLEKQFLLLKWYADKELGAQAILLAREWVVSALCIAQVTNYQNHKERDLIEKQLNLTVEWKKTKGSGISIADFTPPSILKAVKSVEELAATWSKLTAYRNDIAHPQVSPNPVSTATLRKYVKNKLISDLTTLFPQFVA